MKYLFLLWLALVVLRLVYHELTIPTPQALPAVVRTRIWRWQGRRWAISEVMMYQVGRAQAPGKSDPKFDTLAEALQYAQSLGAIAPDTVFAVWDVPDIDETHVVYLLFQDDTYEKA